MRSLIHNLMNINLAAFKPQVLRESFNAWLYAPVAKPSPAREAQSMRWDKPLLFVALALMLLGVIMVYSASIALPDSPKYASYWGEHFFGRQLFFVVTGLIAGWFAFRVNIDKWQKWSWWLFVGAMVLLVLVLVPGIGKGVNGAHRWISLKVFNIQPSEIMKLAMVLFVANFTVRNQQYMHRLTKGFFPVAFFLGIVGILLMMEPDMGALGVVVCIAMGILFLGGFNRVWFAGMAGVLVSLFTMMIVFSPWRRARFFAYLDPWDEVNALGKGYQLSHSLIAFGRGGFTGVGLGGSVEKLHYLPEAHTDFIMAVVGEELGLVGVLVVICMFYWIVKRAFKIGRQCIAMDRMYSGLVAQGIGIWIGVQTFINMGVNLGLLPTKGLTLPLMSYGGSGIVLNCIALAILLRIDYENRKILRGGKC